ncbi:chromosome 1 open reading frame 137 [Homo sapiens]|nr:RecName: Full=Putative uncharacterized protein C1orf137 [Homo sapiens]EAW56660.1 chromosome 1 open reading frame 137 [Homo sapiens]
MALKTSLGSVQFMEQFCWPHLRSFCETCVGSWSIQMRQHHHQSSFPGSLPQETNLTLKVCKPQAPQKLDPTLSSCFFIESCGAQVPVEGSRRETSITV